MKRVVDQHLSIFFCSLASLASINAGYGIGFSSPASSYLKQGDGDLVLTTDEATWFGSILPLTAMFGSLLSGPVMDHFGRRAAIFLLVICFILSWILMFFSNTITMLFTGRGFLGLATGMCTAVVPVYISEVSHASLRGTMGTVFSVSLGLGLPIGYLAGISHSWREMTEIGCIIACFTMLICVVLPKSPYWQISQSESAEASSNLRRLRGRRSDVAKEIKEIEALQSELQNKVTIREITQVQFWKPVMIGLALMVFQQFSGINAIFFYAHHIFRQANFHDENLASILISLVQVIVTIIAAGLMDHSGRRILLILSSAGMMLCHTFLGICMYLTADQEHREMGINVITNGSTNTLANYSTKNISSLIPDIQLSFTNHTDINLNGYEGDQTLLEQKKSVTSWISLAMLVSYVIFYSLGFGPVPYVALSEMLPQRGRGVAGGVVTMTNWLCAFVVTKCFLGLQSALTSSGVFWLFSMVCGLATLFVWRYVPETKGKTLSEIQAIFTVTEKKIPGIVASVKTPIKIGSPVILSVRRSESVEEQTMKLIEEC